MQNEKWKMKNGKSPYAFVRFAPEFEARKLTVCATALAKAA
jgi:hypothetical protein